MHIRLDLDHLTLDDLEALDAAKFDPNAGVWTQVREIFARFAYVDDSEDAERIDYEEAKVKVGKITLRVVMELLNAFSDAMEEVADKAIPPLKSDSSSQPSEE